MYLLEDVQEFGKGMFSLEDLNECSCTRSTRTGAMAAKMQGSFIQNMPFSLYQIQTKFRDEHSLWLDSCT